MSRESNNPFTVGKHIDEHIDRQSVNRQWSEDAYLTPDTASSTNYISQNFDLNKYRWLFFLVIIVFGLLLFRVGYLQVIQGEEYRLAAEENRIRIYDIKSPRGIIYDRNQTVLTQNVPNFSITAVPADLPADQTARLTMFEPLAKILGITVSKFTEKLVDASEYSYQPVVLYDHIPYDQAILLKIKTAGLPGLTLKTTPFREYNNDPYMSHLLGYLGKASETDLAAHPDYAFDDYIGKDGLEMQYENILRGVYGKKEVEVDSLGKEKKVITESKPLHGTNLVLTIDKRLQDTLGESLQKMVNGISTATGGAAVAIDPRNGEVLALVSLPGYDSNQFTEGLDQATYNSIMNDQRRPLFNRAIAAEYPSGSTIKPLIALAALQEGIITDHTTFLSTGGIQINRWFFPDWKAGGHGITDVRKALAESVNTFFYMIGGGNKDFEGLGVDRIKSYLELFGLNGLLGIDLPGEQSGFLPSKEWKKEEKGETWYIGDTYHLSIGQGDLLVTPLQVASYTATIANGGTVYRPHLIKTFANPTTGESRLVGPTVLNHDFIDASYYKTVRLGLRDGVLYGSSRSLNNLPMAVAGKTGTAQFGNEGKTHAWFTSFAPFDDPQIVISVVVEGGGEGYAAALPVARVGLEKWYELYGP